MVRMQEELPGNSAEPHELSLPFSGPFAPWGCSICGRVPRGARWLSTGLTLSTGGQSQQSLHLTALVQLVKEIPEFLFGEVKGAEDYSESGSTSLEGDRATPEGKSRKRQE